MNFKRMISAFLVLSFVVTTLVPIHVDSTQSIASEENGLSVILMIGDGMGYEQVKLGRWVEVGLGDHLVLEQLPWNASMTTHSADADITDSAASGTAIATGTKTNNDVISLDPEGNVLETIAEIAISMNKSTGIVSTCTIYHATPAVFMTHEEDRHNYANIVSQIVENANIDVLLGGGRSMFSPGQIASMESNNYTHIENRDELLNVTEGKVLGLFSTSHMAYEQDRNYATEPSIAEMTNKSLELLSQDADGFFLMVEGGRIDHACHDNDDTRTALDVIAFDEAVQVALDYVEENTNTILIVTADHETEGLVVISEDLNENLPNSLDEAANRNLRIARASNITTEWTAPYHTDTPVPVYCYGPDFFSHLPRNLTIDNTDIFDIMYNYFIGESIEVSDFEQPTATETQTSTSSPTSIPSVITDGPFPIQLLAIPALVIVVIIAVIVVNKRK